MLIFEPSLFSKNALIIKKIRYFIVMKYFGFIILTQSVGSYSYHEKDVD